MQVPTDADWTTDPSELGLDEEYAFNNFHGKTIAQAIKLFEENPSFYQEDLYYMPQRVFAYYIKAYIAYLISESSKIDASDANSFISLD